MNYKEDSIEILPPTLRIGTGASKVDNWATGGLIVGVDVEKKCLKKYGFYKPGKWQKQGKTEIHPDSNIRFEGYEIPNLDMAIETAKKFHSHLKDIHSIGWDIAFTDTGLCFIEGNDNWEITLPQATDHGLKEEFKDLFLDQKKYILPK